MEKQIINKVANSKLKVLSLEDLYPDGERIVLDISNWLENGFVLREKQFRESLKNFDWSSFQGKFVALQCSTGAIVPAWSFMLVSVYLSPFVEKVVIGDLKALEDAIFEEIIERLDLSEYQNLPVIIKGCSKKPVPEGAFVSLTVKLQAYAKSIMYGEACSAVPLFKRNNHHK